MYYVVADGGIRRAVEKEFQDCDYGICVFKLSEWNENPALREKTGIWQRADEIHFCKMETHMDYMYGTYRMPSKLKDTRDITFAIYITKNRVIILDDDCEAVEAVKRLASGPLHGNYNLCRFIYDFLLFFINEDLLFLEKLERDIAVIEEDVLGGRAGKFSYQMLYIKKIIARFYHYYIQLKVAGDELCANENGFFGEADVKIFSRYVGKMERLADETQLLREYAMQVQDVYQSEIEIRQNDVMKLLAIVTTIFLPLTLIAGWYGMNFEFMPETGYKYSYPVVIILSILIVSGCLIYFKKKKIL